MWPVDLSGFDDLPGRPRLAYLTGMLDPARAEKLVDELSSGSFP